MIELDRHIEILLLSNDCVIVPCLGGFVASHVSARYDENDNMFIPPLRTLGFNAKLNVNDSLLVQSYAETYDISYPEAYTRIENEVNELKQHLANNGSFMLNGIGTLYMNKEGNIEFTPCEAGILTPDLYSLSSFEMKKSIKDAPEQGRKKKKAATIPLSSPLGNTGMPLTYVDANETATDKTDIDERRIQIRVSAIRNFVAAVIAVILFLALGTPVNEGNSAMQTSNIDNGIIQKLVNDGYNNIKNAKSIKLEAKKEVSKDTDSIKKKEVKALTQKEATTDGSQAATEEKDYYCLVLASRVTKNNADEFTRSLSKQGLKHAKTLVEKNRSVKVVYGHYDTENEALEMLNNLRGNKYFNEAWVYQVRN